MPFSIAKRFTNLHAGHHLEGVPRDHKCGRPHGHTYSVELFLKADTVTGPGWVRDFGELNAAGEWLKTLFDHQVLNETVSCNPTSELLARYIFNHLEPDLPELVAVRVSESPETWAMYEP
jgi:6-pyruvoyltetrahydropterin/6-carboxytetrahydropterin synthase